MSALTYEDALARLGRALQFGIDPSLEPVRRACALLGDPERRYRVIQVAGTNGKTSVARMCSALLSAHGLRVGHYLSPHLEEYTERFVIDGADIEPGRLAAAMQAVLPAVEAVEGERGQPFTEFELLTVMAFEYFADEGCDAVVLEVGLGGRWDATTAADPEVAVIVTIGLDHTDRLGETEELIAAEKAEIVKPGGRLVLGRVREAARRVIEGRASALGVPVRALAKDVHIEETEAPGGMTGVLVRTATGFEADLWLPTRAPYQRFNAALAVAASEWLLELDGRALDAATASAALAGLSFPGRMEQLSGDQPTLIIDGAHNPDAAAALADALRQALGGRRTVLVVGVMSDKDVRGILAPLVPLADAVVCTRNWSPRSEDPQRLAELVRKLAGERVTAHEAGGGQASAGPDPVEAVASLAHALERAVGLAGEDGVVVVTGSLYTAGEARAWWRSAAGDVADIGR